MVNGVFYFERSIAEARAAPTPSCGRQCQGFAENIQHIVRSMSAKQVHVIHQPGGHQTGPTVIQAISRLHADFLEHKYQVRNGETNQRNGNKCRHMWKNDEDALPQSEWVLKTGCQDLLHRV